jgi:hypothetical protein
LTATSFTTAHAQAALYCPAQLGKTRVPAYAWTRPGRAEFPDLKRMVMSLAAKWHPNAVLVEDKASGQSLIQELRASTRLAVVPARPTVDKAARANILKGVQRNYAP